MSNRDTLVLYRDLFVARGDTYALQHEDGRYLRVPLPVTDSVLRAHLGGHVTAGFYALDQGRCRWVFLDADGPRGWDELRQVQQVLAGDGIPAHLEHSRRGGHLWLFIEQPVAAAAARRTAKAYLEDAGVDVEVYPKQDRARYGSLMRGPFGIHRLSGERYLFAQRGDVEEQLEALWERRVPAEVIETLGRPPRQVEDIRQVCAPPRRRPPKGGSLIDRLNQVLDVWELASQATKLNPKTGMGSCPLHPPDRHPSFGVNREQQWWIDFHGEDGKGGKPAGGDAFELYCRLEGVSPGRGSPHWRTCWDEQEEKTMGAISVIEVASGENARAAFYGAGADAQYEYGHGGYTGTIPEKDVFEMVPVPKGYEPRKAAYLVLFPWKRDGIPQCIREWAEK